MITVNSREQFLHVVKDMLPRNPSCVELGVRKGDYCDLILRVLDPSIVCLVDPWAEGFDINGKVEFYPNWHFPLRTAYSTDTDLEYVRTRFKSEIDRGKVVVHRGFSYEVISSFRDQCFDFIYIDACHIYEAVRWDLEHYLPKLRAGGLLCGHDYVEHPSFGVVKAVDEFCQEYGFEISVLNVAPKYGGDFALVLKE
jgi:hypothetical protein